MYHKNVHLLDVDLDEVLFVVLNLAMQRVQHTTDVDLINLSLNLLLWVEQ